MYWHVNQRLTSFLRVVFISINKICMLDLFPQMKLACCICFHKWNFKSHFKHSFCSYDRDSMTRMLNIVKPISVMFMNAYPRHKISCLHAVFIKERHTKSLHTMSVQIQKRKAILKHRCPLFSFTCVVVLVFPEISLVSFPGSFRCSPAKPLTLFKKSVLLTTDPTLPQSWFSWRFLDNLFQDFHKQFFSHWHTGMSGQGP